MKKRSSSLILISVLSFSFLSSCGSERVKTMYSVSFDTDGGTAIAPIQVEKAHLIEQKPADPIKDGYSFKGWYTASDLLKAWDFDNDVVNADLTLYAGYRVVSSAITDIENEKKAFSNALTFYQSNVDQTFSYKVTLYAATGLDEGGKRIYSATGQDYETEFTSAADFITLNLKSAPKANFYKAEILPLKNGTPLAELKGTKEEVEFKGEGTQANPYGVFEDYDFASIAQGEGEAGQGKYYVQMKDITFIPAYDKAQNSFFSGIYDGNLCNLNVDQANTAAFNRLSASGVIKNLKLTGTITTASLASIGGLANINDGTITNIVFNDYDASVKSLLTSKSGKVGDLSTLSQGGAGLICGTNNGTISNVTVYGNVKANIGGGMVCGINNGTIERAVNKGTIGAGNAVESGKTLSAYSYGGGIAGVNYGTIKESCTTSVGKLLAQRYTTSTPADTSNNRVLGGIAGLNSSNGKILSCFFDGIRCHGDEYIGGISGINEGTIDSCYAKGSFYATTNCHSYIGGRTHVGGIAGLVQGSGTIANCFNTADVYVYTAGDKAYGLASQASNSISITSNFDPRSSGTQTYGNTVTDTLSLPESGSGNTSIFPTSADYNGIDYLLPDYVSLLGSNFVYSAELGTHLKWED